MSKTIWIKHKTREGKTQKYAVDITLHSAANDEWKGCCPLHRDTNPSLHVNLAKQVWHCPVCDVGGGMDEWKFKIDATYDYRDKEGKVLYQVCRQNDPKEFLQRCADGNGGYIWKMKAVKRVLYNLPGIFHHPEAVVFIVEGEKDAETLIGRGYVATTNVNGAGHWRSEYNETLRGRRVVLVPDNDPVGIQHMQAVGKSLVGTAQSIGWLKLPDLHEKEDVSDWFARGGTKDLFDALVQNAPDFDVSLVTQPAGSEDIDLSTHVASPPEGALAAGKRKVQPDNLVTMMLEDQFTQAGTTTVKYYDKLFWIFDGQVYQMVDDDHFLTRIDTYLRKELPIQRGFSVAITMPLVREMAAILKLRVLVNGGRTVPCWCDGDPPAEGELWAIRNGILAIDRLLSGRYSDLKDILFPHHPRFFATACLPFDFDPAACCPRWQAFLAQTFVDDTESGECLQEWFGYNIGNANNLKTFALLTGPTDSGKSVVTSLLVALVGEDNTSHIPLEDFAQDFKLVGIYGKKANICTEIHSTSPRAEQMLKAITGGDRIQLNRKFRDPLSFFPTVKITFTCNDTPHWDEKNDALFNRNLTILFPHSVPKDQQDRELTAKLKTELAGIFNWAVEGYRRLRETQSFTVSKRSQQALEEQRLKANSARLYIAENLTVQDGQQINENDLYRRYRQWAEESGYRGIFSKAKFGEELERYHPSVRRRRLNTKDKGRDWFYDGVTFVGGAETAKHEPEDNDSEEHDRFFSYLFKDGAPPSPVTCQERDKGKEMS